LKVPPPKPGRGSDTGEVPPLSGLTGLEDGWEGGVERDEIANEWCMMKYDSPERSVVDPCEVAIEKILSEISAKSGINIVNVEIREKETGMGCKIFLLGNLRSKVNREENSSVVPRNHRHIEMSRNVPNGARTKLVFVQDHSIQMVQARHPSAPGGSVLKGPDGGPLRGGVGTMNASNGTVQVFGSIFDAISATSDVAGSTFKIALCEVSWNNLCICPVSMSTNKKQHNNMFATRETLLMREMESCVVKMKITVELKMKKKELAFFLDEHIRLYVECNVSPYLSLMEIPMATPEILSLGRSTKRKWSGSMWS